jgi:pterin-4a-carbinolamine dehydratase
MRAARKHRGLHNNDFIMAAKTDGLKENSEK